MAITGMGDSVLLPPERKPGPDRDSQSFPNVVTVNLFFCSSPEREAERPCGVQ